MTTASAPLVFVPGLGFRPVDSRMLRTPVTHQAEGWSVSVDSVIADREGTQVAVTIWGPFRMKGERYAQPDVDYEGFIQARDRSGAVASERGAIFPMSHSVSHTGTSISCTANMAALAGTSEEIEILIGEPLPITIIRVSLSPLSDLALPARAVDVSDEHHGVVITAQAIARGADMTAVLLHATLLPHTRQRFMRGLGTIRDTPREPPGITVEDDMGTEIAAYAATRELSAGPELRTVAVLPGLGADARAATVIVPYVVLAEYTGAPVRLAVPFEGQITLGGDDAFVKVERRDAPRGGAGVGVEFNGAWRADRRLLYAESISVGAERNGGVGFRGLPSEPPVQTYAEDLQGGATQIALESPVVQLRGPWRLPVTLP